MDREIYHQSNRMKKMNEINQWLDQVRKIRTNRINELDSQVATKKNKK